MSVTQLDEVVPASRSLGTLPPKKLTPQQIKFIEQIMGGHSQADAYRIAYRPAKRRGTKDISVASCRIAAHPLIRAKLAELRGRSDKETLLSLNQRLQILAGIAQNLNTKQTDRIRAVEVYSKIAGDQAPDRQEVTIANAPGSAFTLNTRPATKAEKIAAMAVARVARASQAS